MRYLVAPNGGIIDANSDMCAHRAVWHLTGLCDDCRGYRDELQRDGVPSFLDMEAARRYVKARTEEDRKDG